MGIFTDRTEITVAEKRELDETLDVLKTINEDNAQCDNGTAHANIGGAGIRPIVSFFLE